MLQAIEDNNRTRSNESASFMERANATLAGIDGLTAGVQAMKAASSGKSLLSVQSSLTSATERLLLSHNLQVALQFGEEYLSKADFTFMRDILTGQVGLAGDASPKKGADASGSRLAGVIQKLEELSAQLTTDLAKDSKADQESQTSFEKRHLSKHEEKLAADALLTQLIKENAARDQAKADAVAEIDTLTEQSAADEKTVAEVQAALDSKAKEWDERSLYRAGEQQALGKAIELLQSDDARDLFAKSFLQIATNSKVFTERAQTARHTLLSSAAASKDHRLLVLASHLTRFVKNEAGNPNFDTVIAKIDKLKEAIETEEESDLKKKQDCQETATADQATVKEHTAKVQDLNTNEGFLQDKVEESTSGVEKAKAKIEEVKAALATASQIRATETAEYLQEKQDNEAAKGLLSQAAKVIQDFYDKATPSFLQKDKMGSGTAEAPATWSAPLGGQSAQSTGVVQALKTVADDMAKQNLVSDKEEAEAESLFNKTKSELELEIKSLGDTVDTLTIKKGDYQASLEANAVSLNQTAGLLQAVQQKMKDAEPQCNFYTTNYEARRKNRITELDGLDKAKAVLKGALFEKNPRGESLLSVAVIRHRLRR